MLFYLFENTILNIWQENTWKCVWEKVSSWGREILTGVWTFFSLVLISTWVMKYLFKMYIHVNLWEALSVCGSVSSHVFLLLVIISYTANLAAHLTAKMPSIVLESMVDLQKNNIPLYIPIWNEERNFFRRNFEDEYIKAVFTYKRVVKNLDP